MRALQSGILFDKSDINKSTMFIGHFGVGFGAKKAAPGISLGTLFIAVQFLDLLWPTLLLFNIENVEIHPELSAARTLAFTYYPYSHSLALCADLVSSFWSYIFHTKERSQNCIHPGLCVLSHWILDLIVHFPDLPLVPRQITSPGSWSLEFNHWDSCC